MGHLSEEKSWELRQEIWELYRQWLTPHEVDFSRVVNNVKKMVRYTTVVRPFVHKMSLLEEEVRHAGEDFDEGALHKKIDELHEEVRKCVTKWDEEDALSPEVLSIHSVSAPSPNPSETSLSPNPSEGASEAS